MNPSSLKEKGHILLGNGYELIPIKKKSKIPAISGWQNTKATPEDIEKSSPPRFNSAIRLGVPHLKIVNITINRPPRGNRYLNER